MIRSKIVFLAMFVFMAPYILLAGWDWPAGPGTSMSKVADVDNQNTGLSTPGQKIVYNPENDRVQLIYIPDLVTYPNSRLMYAYSEDDGETFTSLGPIDIGNYARNTAMATDANDIPYITWCEYDGPVESDNTDSTVAIYFAKDEEFGAGLFEAKLVSDPTQLNYTKYGYTSIVVSPDGQNIIIAWHSSKPADQLQPYGIQIVRSTDGGETFSEPIEVVSPLDLPSVDPAIANVESPAMVMGENGYVFLLCDFLNDPTAQSDLRPAFIESFDYGENWSTPAVIPTNPEAPYGHNWYTTFGSPILVNGEPHFVMIFKPESFGQPGDVAVWHYKRENGNWISKKVSPPWDAEDQFFENSNFASIGKDMNNNLYICYLTTSIAPGYYWGMMGLHVSSDNGQTWNEYPLPLHDYIADQGTEFRSSLPCIAQNVGLDKILILGLQGGYWSGTPKAVWVFHADPNEIADYTAPEKQDFPSITDALYTFDDAVPFVWNEINSKGTAIERSSWVPDPDDGSVGPIDMGIEFEFYGQTFSSCYISPNGQISLSEPLVLVAPAEGTATIPGIAYDNLFCVFAGDLNNGAYPNPPYSSKSGTVYYYHDHNANTFTVEWENLNNHAYVENNLCVDTTITFQAVFNGYDRSVTYYYKDVGIGGFSRGVIIGLQPSKNDTLGVQYYGGGFPRDGYPSNEDAVKFYPRDARIVDQYYDIDDTIPFEWIEISSYGTKIERSEWISRWAAPDADDGGVRIPMGINFDFYDNTFDSVTISVNGFMSFTDWADWIEGPTKTGTTIPGLGYNNAVCVFMADLLNGQYPDAPYLSRSGSVYYYSDPAANKFIVEWQNLNNHYYVVNNQCVDTTITFQCILDANDNSLTFSYKDIGIADPLFAERTTIGIQPSMDGTLGVQYYGGGQPLNGYPVNETSIKIFKRPVSSVPRENSAQPLTCDLYQNYPNPFNPMTTIKFSIDEDNFVSLTIYNVIGQEVRLLIEEDLNAGMHEVQWNARDNHNSPVQSGIYIYKLKVNGKYETRKMLLLK